MIDIAYEQLAIFTITLSIYERLLMLDVVLRRLEPFSADQAEL